MKNKTREEIDSLYEKMNQSIDPTTFELQESYFTCEKKILELQSKCKHHFVNGKCEYCDKGDL